MPLMQQVFEGHSVPDPGSPMRRRVCWVIAVILIFLVTGMQQIGVMAEGAKPVPTVEPVDPDAVKKPVRATPLGDDLDAPDIAGRLAVKMGIALSGGNEANKRQLTQLVNPEEQGDIEHSVRVVPAYTELVGKEEGLEMIERVRSLLANDERFDDAAHAAMETDLEDLTALYTDGSASLSPERRTRIEERLGWQGRLALSFDRPDTDPARAALLANGGWLLAFLILVGLGLICVVVGGFGMFVWAAVLFFTKKLPQRLDRPALGGSLGVEVLVVFLTGFLGLKIVLSVFAAGAAEGWFGEGLKNDGEGTFTAIALLAQWVVLPMVVLYPHLRGYNCERTRRAMGWHRGTGFGREILAGIAGYLACIPLYIGAVMVSLVLLMIEQAIKKELMGHEPSGPVNPIGGMLSQSWWLAILVIALATVWAPIVEETVFRGGLFRQLSARMSYFWSAVISGTVFAMMHGYSPSLFPPLIALGAGFALMRVWRGSIVSCITAHALHNGTLTVMMLIMFSLLK